MSTKIDAESEPVTNQSHIPAAEDAKDDLNIYDIGVASAETKGSFGFFSEVAFPPFYTVGYS